MINETITAEESKVEKNEGSNFSMKKNESKNNKINEGNQIINEKEDKNNNKRQEQILDKNIIKSSEIEFNSQININNSEDNSKEKNSINEGTKKGKNYNAEEKLNKIDDKVNDNSKKPENNNNVDKINEPKDSCQAINSQSSKSELTKKDEYAKNESTKGYENESNLLIRERETKASPEIQYLINEIHIIEKRSNERYEEINKMSNELQTEIVALTNQLENVQEEHRKIADILDKIQMRDRAKNIFMPFEQLLKDEDLIKIKEDRNKKWKLIAQRAKEYYKNYNNSNKYKSFAEIMDKSVELMAKGNKAAHDINLEYYEKDINRIIEENKNKIINPIKLCFLLQIDISKDSLLDGYDFLDTFYENDMTLGFTQGKSYE